MFFMFVSPFWFDTIWYTIAHKAGKCKKEYGFPPDANHGFKYPLLPKRRERASTVPQGNRTCGTGLGELVRLTISPECIGNQNSCTADRSMPGPYIGVSRSTFFPSAPGNFEKTIDNAPGAACKIGVQTKNKEGKT